VRSTILRLSKASLLGLLLLCLHSSVRAQSLPPDGPSSGGTPLTASKERPPAQTTVQGLTCNRYHFVKNMFNDLCWKGIFPMRLAGMTLSGSSGYLPEDAYKKSLCKCGGSLKDLELPKIGFHVGMWMPSRLIDVTRRPFCFPSWGGQTIGGLGAGLLEKGANIGPSDRDSARFMNWAMYSAPIIYILKLLDDSACAPDGIMDFDLLYMSPMLPMWNDGMNRYSMFINPELVLFSNPAMLASQPIEITHLITTKKPMNKMFWQAGAWGSMTPYTGIATGVPSDVEYSSLMAARAMAVLHRLGLVKDTVGESNMCRRKERLIMRKDAFRWQMVAPSPETKGSIRLPGQGGSNDNGQAQAEGAFARIAEFSANENTPVASDDGDSAPMTNFASKLGTCNHPTGYPALAWGLWRSVPGTGEDHSYMVFRWTDCCFGFNAMPK